VSFWERLNIRILVARVLGLMGASVLKHSPSCFSPLSSSSVSSFSYILCALHFVFERHGVGCRGAWESSGEVRDQLSKQRQMMADGNLRGFWSKQGRFRLKKCALACIEQSTYTRNGACFGTAHATIPA